MADETTNVFGTWILAASSVTGVFVLFIAHIAFLRYYEDLYIEDTFLILILSGILAFSIKLRISKANKGGNWFKIISFLVSFLF